MSSTQCNAQKLGLSAGHVPVELRETQHRRAHALLVDLRRLALRLETLAAHKAVSARDVKRHHDAVAGAYLRDLRANFLDDTHRFVTEDIALLDEHAEHLIEVQVGSANRRRRNAYDSVGGLLNGWIGYVIHPYVALTVPRYRFHVFYPRGSVDLADRR